DRGRGALVLVLMHPHPGTVVVVVHQCGVGGVVVPGAQVTCGRHECLSAEPDHPVGEVEHPVAVHVHGLTGVLVRVRLTARADGLPDHYGSSKRGATERNRSGHPLGEPLYGPPLLLWGEPPGYVVRPRRQLGDGWTEPVVVEEGPHIAFSRVSRVFLASSPPR